MIYAFLLSLRGKHYYSHPAKEGEPVMSNARAGERILGSLRSADGKGIVRIEGRFDTGIDDLWLALTDPAVSPAGSVR